MSCRSTAWRSIWSLAQSTIEEVVPSPSLQKSSEPGCADGWSGSSTRGARFHVFEAAGEHGAHDRTPTSPSDHPGHRSASWRRSPATASVMNRRKNRWSAFSLRNKRALATNRVGRPRRNRRASNRRPHRHPQLGASTPQPPPARRSGSQRALVATRKHRVCGSPVRLGRYGECDIRNDRICIGRRSRGGVGRHGRRADDVRIGRHLSTVGFLRRMHGLTAHEDPPT